MSSSSRSGSSIYDFTAKDIDGVDVSLSKYRGYVCLIVNVACK
nr:Glutathione peroxidase [Schistosoma japonicum]CAX75820.1 Glutathione peroxidase [Schistosoma japonicum]